MSPLLSFFRGQRVLVIGDSGFKGSWLSAWLHLLGAEVTGYSLPPRPPDNHFTCLSLRKKIRHIDGDVRDLAHLQNVCRKFQPTFLFHLAAQSLVRFSYEDPKTTFDVNVGGAVNVLEVARSLDSLRSLVFVTSDKCYRNKEWVWGYRENDELGGNDPYSASKASAEMVFASYQESFFRHRPGVGMASVRAGNVIGGGDWAADRIVPDCVRALRQGKPIVLRAPSSTRPWQHVLDPLYGYLLLAHRLFHYPAKYSGAWNFGPRYESSRTVKELATKIIRSWKGGKLIIQRPKRAPHEATWLFLNCDKANKELGWRSHWDFDRSVAETVGWYKAFCSGKDAYAITRGQIETFMELVRDS